MHIMTDFLDVFLLGHFLNLIEFRTEADSHSPI